MAPTEPPGRSGPPWVGPALVVGLGVLAVLGAAWGGPWDFTFRLLGGNASRPDAPDPVQRYRSMPPMPTTSSPVPWWVTALVVAVLVLVGVVIAYVVGRWLWKRLPRRQIRLEAEEIERPAAQVQPDLSRLAAGALSALDLLDRVADPKDAVIRAWLALEAAAERSGVPRDPAATPSEFTAAVLGRTSAEPDAVRSLLGRYHRARFSGHPVSTDDVRAARDSVLALSRTWRSYDDALRASIP